MTDEENLAWARGQLSKSLAAISMIERGEIEFFTQTRDGTRSNYTIEKASDERRLAERMKALIAGYEARLG